MTTASPEREPDILIVGPAEGGRPAVRRVLMVLAPVVALLAALVFWRLQPAEPRVFTLPDLQGVYAGMVRSDGTNDASVIDRSRVQEESGYVIPAACQPLFEATALNRMPGEAVDGVGTFWAIGPSAVSLFSYRFPDVASANREYKRLSDALGNCRNRHVEVHAEPAGIGVLTGTRDDPAGTAAAQLGYVVGTNDGTKLAVHVLAFSNTVSWQFRYEPTAGAYAPLTAQRVMDSLSDQMRSVQEVARER